MDANGVAPGTGPDLAGYRGAVADLLLEIASHTGPEDLPKAERVLPERLADAEFAPVLAASRRGAPRPSTDCSARCAIISPPPAIARPIWPPISGFTFSP